jgi:signal transduction histidine kinase
MSSAESNERQPLNDAEQYREILAHGADYLYGRHEEITAAWLSAIGNNPQIPTAHELTRQQLTDHLPRLYDELCAYLKREPEAAEQAVDSARKHGEHRWVQGYRIDELVREIGVLRRIVLSSFVTQFATEKKMFGGAEEIALRNAIDEFFSIAMVSSVRQYVEEREHIGHAYSAQLQEANARLAAANKQLSEHNEQLQKVDSSRLRLTSMVAHEISNVLHGLSIAIQLLNSSDPALSARGRKVAQRQITNMRALLDQLMDYSALLAGRRDLELATINIAELYEEWVAIYKPLASSKGLGFESAYDASLDGIISDRLALNQIASNLLSNALKYTEQGEIRLFVRSVDADTWAIVVEDTGIGIAAEDQPYIFDEFQRFLGGRNIAGSGLGLAVTKGLVQLLKGSITVTSDHGKGSRFEVVVPKKPTAA